MVAIHEVTQSIGNQIETGIRPFDIGQDVRPVANLIADAFAQELDSRGEAALRELYILSYMSGVIRLLNRSTSEFQDVFNGFVWVDHGRVVGNVTVQKADSYGNRWQIANVAVAPSHRGRGIARALMETALDHVRQMGGQWAVLQVRANNEVALGLYTRMGFENMGGTVYMEIGRVPEAVSAPHGDGLQPFSAYEWQPLYDLANSHYDAQSQWWRAIRRSDFQVSLEQHLVEWLSRLAGRQMVYRRAIQEFPKRFEAALILTVRRWRGHHSLQLWVRPAVQGKYERTLIDWALSALHDTPRWPVRISLSTGHTAALELLKSYGFRTQYTLLTMRRPVRP